MSELEQTTIQTSPANPCGFGTTDWSVVRAARERGGAAGEKALEALCKRYWAPVYVFIRSQPFLPDDAQDLTQAFFAQLLNRDFLRNVDSRFGRFRSFLLTAAKNFLADQRDRASAQKRGGHAQIISLNAMETEEGRTWEPPDRLDPESIFERRWALILLESVLQKLEKEIRAREEGAQFEALKGFLVGEKTGGGYAEAGARLNKSEGSIKTMVWRWRERLRDLLLAEVAATVASPEEAEAELRHILSKLGSA